MTNQEIIDSPLYFRLALLQFAADLLDSEDEGVVRAASRLLDAVREEHYKGEFDEKPYDAPSSLRKRRIEQVRKLLGQRSEDGEVLA